MLKGDSFQQDVENAPPEGWLFIDSLIQPPEGSVTVVLIILFVVTQLAAGIAMTVRGQGLEGPQRFIVFGLPLLFAPFVASFEAGLSVYWISTNIWTFGQQQLVYKLMGPMKKPTDEEVAESTKAPPPPPRRRKKKKGRTR
jgi:YidC/Oxa1 family membrane protein insertase